jgi:hypothetical protein
MSKIVRLLMPVGVAVVLGPLIAGLAVGLLAIAVNLFDRTAAMPWADVVTLCGFYVVFAYVIGAPVALLAGALVSLWMIRRPPTAVVVIAAAVVATGVYMGVGALGYLGPVEFNNARNNFLFTLALAVIAAFGCWLLTRRFARPA